MANKRATRFLLFFTISFLLCAFITSVYISSRTKLETTQMEQLAMSKSNKISSVLTKLLYKTQILSAFVQQSDGQLDSFERIAATIIDDSSIRNVLLAPAGIVSHVYPLEGNESVLGLDFFSEQEGNQEARLAKKTGQLVLGGPFNLIQGGQALVGRLPIYLNQNERQDFWGIVSVTLNYPQALADADLDQLQNEGFAFEIWRINPDTNERQIITSSQYSYTDKMNFVEYPMNILNSKWYFRLAPIRHWYQFPETWMFTSIGLLISILIGLLMLHNYDLRNMKYDLEQISLMDSLTGIYNRRGCLQQLERLLEHPDQPFILAYIDLNHFKHINDRYGHSSGDALLKHFADRFAPIAEADRHIFARIGGDEFILIYKHISDSTQVEAWLHATKESLSHEGIQLYDEHIPITYSVGYASFPEDGTTSDKLISIADYRMYQSKKEC